MYFKESFNNYKVRSDWIIDGWALVFKTLDVVFVSFGNPKSGRGFIYL